MNLNRGLCRCVVNSGIVLSQLTTVTLYCTTANQRSTFSLFVFKHQITVTLCDTESLNKKTISRDNLAVPFHIISYNS